jgi:glycerol-3-phosphate acyltransferase PlsY
VVEKAITLRFVFFVHFCGGKSDHSTLCVLCALLWWKKRSLYALCSLCTFVVEKAITLRFVYSKKSEAITLRFVFFVHFCGGKSDHSTLCVLKKERSDHSTLCVLCALLWWKKRSLYALCTQKRAKRSLYALCSLCTFVVEKVDATL